MKALLIVAALGAAARAEPRWKASAGGTVEPGRLPGSYVVSSDAAPGRYSEASMVTVEPVALPYTVSARWRRLGPEAGRSMHVIVDGGVVLVKSGAISFWAYDNVEVPGAAWRPLPGYAAHAEHAIRVAQDARGVTVTIDGAVVATYAVPTQHARATIGFGMKSAPGVRSAIYLRDVGVQ